MKNKENKSNNDFFYETIPFKLVDRLIFVQAEVNGKNGYFLFDNGSPGLVLNSNHFSNDSEEKGNKIFGVGGSEVRTSKIKIENFTFCNRSINNMQVQAQNLESLDEKFNDEVFGILGYSIFKNYDIEFHYSESTILLINPLRREEYLQEKDVNIVPVEISLRMCRHFPAVKVTIDSKPYFVGVDSGAELTLFSERHEAQIVKPDMKFAEDTLTKSDGTIDSMKVYKLDKMNISDIEIDNIDLGFANIDRFNNGMGFKLDAISGYEVLSKCRTILSFKNRKLFFFNT